MTNVSATTEPQRPGSQKYLPIAQRYAVTAQVAADFSGLSRTRVYEFLADGLLEGKVVKGRRLVIVSSLLKLLGQSPSTAKRERAA